MQKMRFSIEITAPRDERVNDAYPVAKCFFIPEVLQTCVHREPHSSGYADRRELAATELLTPLFAPSLEVRLAELDLG